MLIPTLAQDVQRPADCDVIQIGGTVKLRSELTRTPIPVNALFPAIPSDTTHQLAMAALHRLATLGAAMLQPIPPAPAVPASSLWAPGPVLVFAVRRPG